MIERFCQSPKLIMRGRHRQWRPKTLPVRDTVGHQRSVPCELVDGSKASTHIQGRDAGGQKQAQRQKKQGHASKVVDDPAGTKCSDSHGENTLLRTLLKGYERQAHRFTIGDGRYSERGL